MGEFSSDERGIEGLPIRLVIALVVGVAALSMMMTILDGVGQVGQTELHYELDNEDKATIPSNSNTDITFLIRDEDGDRIDNATVIVSSGTAQLNEPISGADGQSSDGDSSSSPNSEVKLTITGHSLRQGQDIGTLEVNIVPPGDSNFVDDEENREIRVLRSG